MFKFEGRANLRFSHIYLNSIQIALSGMEIRSDKKVDLIFVISCYGWRLEVAISVIRVVIADTDVVLYCKIYVPPHYSVVLAYFPMMGYQKEDSDVQDMVPRKKSVYPFCHMSTTTQPPVVGW